jgi:hypothetical protein
MNTFTGTITTKVNSNPDDRFASWHNAKGKVIEDSTFAKLWDEADIVAYHLRETWKLGKGDRIVLCYSSGLQFFASFLGCMRAGITAVLVYPPSQPLVKSLHEMTRVVNDCNAKLIILDSKVQMLRLSDQSETTSKSRHLWPKANFEVHMNLVKGNQGGSKSLTAKNFSETRDEVSVSLESPIAFIQYRSGTSIGTSKGVGSMVTYGALDSSKAKSVILAMLQTYNIDVNGSGEARKQGEPYGIVDLSWLPQNDDTLLLKEKPNNNHESGKELVIKNTKSYIEGDIKVNNNINDNNTAVISTTSSQTNPFETDWKVRIFLLVVLFSIMMAWHIGENRVQSYFLMFVKIFSRSTGQQMEASSARETSPSLLQYLKKSSFYPIRIAPLLISCIIAQVLLCGVFLHYIYKQYNTHFGGKRLHRSEENSPSSCKLDPPSVRSWESYRKQHDDLNDSYKLHQNLFTPSAASQKPAAAELDMDHVHINPFQLLWAFTFVGPFSYLLWKKASILLKLRIFLVERGVLSKKPVDLGKLVGKLVLEQSQVVHYVGRVKKTRTRKQGSIAGFFFPGKCIIRDVPVVTYYYGLLFTHSYPTNPHFHFIIDFPYVDKAGKLQIATFLSVDIDLNTKRMVSCKMDDESLTASEALILLWYNTISAQHVKVHALGNWGINVGNESTDINPFLQRNSIVSVVYNYFGFTSFPTFMEEWKKEGLLSKDWDPQALTDTFIHGVKENVCQHSHVTELMSHSDFVNFITKTRSIFHKEFAKHKHMFPGVHPEGLFAGTVLHSLDHELMEKNLEDPLWLDVDDARFGKMAELGRVVRVGFVPEVPGYYFHRHFRGSGHPFYEAVYARAAKINKEMADNMETCICR